MVDAPVTRFPMRVRRLHVDEVRAAGERFVSIWFAGPELDGFVSPGPGDHVKLQVPGADGVLVLPRLEEGRVVNRAELALRDMTPREFVDGRLRIDFARHGGGEVGRWLEQASLGDEVAILGPRGSRPAVTGVDAVCCIVDATALPSALRRAEAQAPGTATRIHLVVREAGDVRVPLPAGVELVEHVLGDDVDAGGWSGVAADALAALPTRGSHYLWSGGEAAGVASVRAAARELERDGLTSGFNGYWRLGVAAFDHHAPLPQID